MSISPLHEFETVFISSSGKDKTLVGLSLLLNSLLIFFISLEVQKLISKLISATEKKSKNSSKRFSNFF